MRTESEIERALKMFDTLTREQIELGLPVQDDFQRGMVLGKQIILRWALGENNGSLVGTFFNRETWESERQEGRFSELAPGVTED